MTQPRADIAYVPLSDEEIETSNKVFALRFQTGDVHSLPEITLRKMVCDTLSIDSDDFQCLYKLLGSGNTFYLEVNQDCQESWQYNHYRFEVETKERNGENIVKVFHFTVEDARIPRTSIKLESVPVGTKDKTLIKYFSKFLEKSCTVEDIKVISKGNTRDDVRFVIMPLIQEAKIPDYIRFENINKAYEQPCLVILPGRKQKCMHCGSEAHFTYSTKCPQRPKRATIKPRIIKQKPVALMGLNPVPNGSCLSQDSTSNDTPPPQLSSLGENPKAQPRRAPSPTASPTTTTQTEESSSIQDTPNPDPTPRASPSASQDNAPSDAEAAVDTTLSSDDELIWPTPAEAADKAASSDDASPSVAQNNTQESTVFDAPRHDDGGSSTETDNESYINPFLVTCSDQEMETQEDGFNLYSHKRKRKDKQRTSSLDRSSEESSKTKKKIPKKSKEH